MFSTAFPARPDAASRKSKTAKPVAVQLAEMGKTLVCSGAVLVAISIAAALIRFPLHSDVANDRSGLKSTGYGGYYAKIYVAPKAANATAAKDANPDANEDIYVQYARKAVVNQRILPRVKEFVQKFGLQNAHVLDVGAGTGYLQDVVKDYVGLDISPTASRYYHKPYIEASATDMPVPDNDFDAVWTVWVLEHVPNPEQALLEIRRVTKDNGIIFLLPAWSSSPFAGQGYDVRPYSDFDWKGKLIKTSMYVSDHTPLVISAMLVNRLALGVRSYFTGPTRLYYSRLNPNYEQYWQGDSDAVNSLDRYETSLWFQSRGDECLNCDNRFWTVNEELLIRVHKPAKR